MLELSFEAEPSTPSPDRRARQLKLARAADAGGEHHVGSGAMADADARRAEPPNLVVVEVDAVREPGATAHPAGLLQEIDRPHPVDVEAEPLLVGGFAEMRVKLAVVALGETRGLDHQRLVDGERRTGGERDADVRARRGIVKQFQHALAVGEDRVAVLHYAIRRQAAVFFAEVHRSARDRHPHADLARGFGLDVDGAVESGREQIMVVRRRRAAGQQKLRKRDAGGRGQRVGRQPRPDWIQRLQPRKQVFVDRLRMRAGQRLIKMMVRVDEAGQYDVAARIEGCVDRRGGRRPSAHEFDDAPVLDDEAACGVLGEDRERGLDPGSQRGNSEARATPPGRLDHERPAAPSACRAVVSQGLPRCGA